MFFSNRDSSFLQKIMPQELFEALQKSLVKLNTNSVVDIQELNASLQVVPKAVVAFLMKEIQPMKKDEAKEIKLPFADNAIMLVNKNSQDVYGGHITQDGKIAHRFELCSIPQLAAHLMSHFELYDEKQEESSKEASVKESQVERSDAALQAQIDKLNDKIDKLMMIMASKQDKTVIVNNTEHSPVKEESSVEESSQSEEVSEESEQSKALEKNYKQHFAEYYLNRSKRKQKQKLEKGLKNLKKAGLAPKMPSPPKPGTKVGGSQGITMAGLHGNKTPHSDLNQKPVTQLKSPYAKTLKSLTIKKSELTGNCVDCRQNVAHCLCFRALSKPEITKNDGENITMSFKQDWDKESISALYKSIKRGSDE